MEHYVALLRGVNVGGRHRVPMAELRSAVGALGVHDVTSVIQSGNVCLTTERPASEVGAAVRTVVADRFGVDVPVVVRSAAQIAAALAAHPFTDDGLEPKYHHVWFLADPPPAEAAEHIGDHRPGADYRVIGRELHVVFPGGSARSTLTTDLVDRRLGTTVTGRNLPTCEKIAADLAGR